MKSKQKSLVDPVAYCEENYPETVESFKELQQIQFGLFCSKQMDYGPENIAVNSQLKTSKDIQISLIGLVYRMNDKMNRLVNLVIRNNRNAQNEPVLDSFKDLSVYGIIAQIVEQGRWGK